MEDVRTLELRTFHDVCHPQESDRCWEMFADLEHGFVKNDTRSGHHGPLDNSRFCTSSVESPVPPPKPLGMENHHHIQMIFPARNIHEEFQSPRAAKGYLLPVSHLQGLSKSLAQGATSPNKWGGSDKS